MKRLFIPVLALMAIACNNTSKEQQTQNNQESQQTSELVANSDSTICSMQLGGFKVTWIRDNAKRKDNELKLFGNVSDELADSLGIKNGIPASMSAVLLEKDSIKILCDAGLGMSDCLLIPSLNSLGVKPEEILLVYITHLHPDHIGGLMTNGEKVFPNAKVYVAKAEFDAWMAMPAEQNQMQVAFSKMYADNLQLFNYNDTLPAGVVPMEAKGHTPGHTVFQADNALVIGDLMHGMALQMVHPEYCAMYDMDPEEAVKSRIKYIDYAQKNGLTMVGMHLPEPGFK